ncbi:EI24 domain-containing protein [Paracrocinitomix mangrovi]|uniref:EI24 domain-containing protein n=1 Tax=Paracrocinitomix mangrovi TaxID=2862509 RepID=UPI001C8ED86D|nr:EI24 domain-containing protein [Paracrocinitomix mangrovi]UKN01626.1 EI24 domain-containing protein [Paracrocinitomix mangrovi]
MNFFKLYGLGIKNYWLGIKLLIQHRLYWFILFPIALFVLIFLIGNYFEQVEYSISSDVQQNLSTIDSINGLIWKTIRIIFFDQLHYMFTKFTMYLVIMCLAPVLAYVSEKVEEIITGKVYKWNFFQIVKDIKRAVVLNTRLILVEYAIILILLGIGTLIGGQVRFYIAFVIPIIIGFYFYGFGYIDYILERRRLDIRQSIHFVGRHKGLAFALGSIYASCFLSFDYVWRKFPTVSIDNASQIFWGTILVVLFILAVSAPILTIISSTLSMHEIVDLSTNEFSVKKEDKNGVDENADNAN